MHDRPLTFRSAVDTGLMLYLSNDSAWEIRASDRERAGKWPKGTAVGIYRTNDRDFPFRLVLRPGKADGDVVSAKRLERVR